MKKIFPIISFAFAAFFFALPATAQSGDKAMQIKKIMLDPAYMFAEATMKEAADAREIVCLTLTNLMNEYLSEMGESRRVAAAELGAIKYITETRGDSEYVFGYIPVASFYSGSPQPSVEDTQPSVVEETQPSVVEETQPTVVEQKRPSTKSTHDDGGKEAEMGAKIIQSMFGDSAPSITHGSSPIEAIASEGDSNGIADMTAEIIETGDARKAAYTIALLKAIGKIKDFGSVRNCTDSAGSFWLIIDTDGTLLALLGKGTDDNRHNYVTGTKDHLANYGGKYAIWFRPLTR